MSGPDETGLTTLSESRVCFTVPFARGDCVIALASRALRSQQRLIPRWPFKHHNRSENFLSDHLQDPWPLTEAVRQITGAQTSDLVAEQVPTWKGTTLVTPEITATVEGWTNRISTASVPICPVCLGERPWAIRALWRIPILPVCLEHRVLLVHRCLDCGGAIRNTSTRESGRTIHFASGACDNCGANMPPPQRAPLSAETAVARLNEELHRQVRKPLSATPNQIDLAAVQDLVNLLRKPPRRKGAAKSIYTQSPELVASQLSIALGLYDGTLDPEKHLAEVSRARIMNYYHGRGGLRRPRVLHLLTQASRATRPESTVSTGGPSAVSWPRSLPDGFLIGLTDILHDAAHHQGLDPTPDTLFRWASLIAAHTLNASDNRVTFADPATTAETKMIKRLLATTDELGTRERLDTLARDSAATFLRAESLTVRQRSSARKSTLPQSA